jgi:hypothetical protein
MKKVNSHEFISLRKIKKIKIMWLIWKENGEIIEWYPWFVMNIFGSV